MTVLLLAGRPPAVLHMAVGCSLWSWGPRFWGCTWDLVLYSVHSPPHTPSPPFEPSPTSLRLGCWSWLSALTFNLNTTVYGSKMCLCHVTGSWRSAEQGWSGSVSSRAVLTVKWSFGVHIMVAFGTEWCIYLFPFRCIVIRSSDLPHIQRDESVLREPLGGSAACCWHTLLSYSEAVRSQVQGYLAGRCSDGISGHSSTFYYTAASSTRIAKICFYVWQRFGC